MRAGNFAVITSNSDERIRARRQFLAYVEQVRVYLLPSISQCRLTLLSLQLHLCLLSVSYVSLPHPPDSEYGNYIYRPLHFKIICTAQIYVPRFIYIPLYCTRARARAHIQTTSKPGRRRILRGNIGCFTHRVTRDVNAC